MEKIISLITSLLLTLAPVPQPMQEFKQKQQIKHLYKEVAPSVVFITKLNADGTFNYGSGFFYEKDNAIVTAGHVVDMASGVTVDLINGMGYSAKVVTIDQGRDLALLEVDIPEAERKEINIAKLRATEKFTKNIIGSKVVALGHPFKFKYSYSAGVVSQIRPSVLGNQIIINDAIQTDSALNPGNSGCPVFDLRGRVIGIASFVVGSRTYTGVAFLIPTHRIKEFVDGKPLGEPIYE